MKVLITTRTTELIRDTLKDIAEYEHRTISQQVDLILTDYVRTLPALSGKIDKPGRKLSGVPSR